MNQPPRVVALAQTTRVLAAPTSRPAEEPVRPPTPRDRIVPADKVKALKEMAEAAWAKNTRTAYRRGWLLFKSWCEKEGRTPLIATPETVALFLEGNRDKGLQTLSHALAAVRWYHGMVGEASPTATPHVRAIWKGLRNQKGTAPKNAKDPITLTELTRLIAQVDRTTLMGKRDAALLLVGFCGALRRSELVGIDVEHLHDTPGGLAVMIPRSKGDQQGEGQTVGIAAQPRVPPLCPVTALRAWLEAAEIQRGSVFVMISQGLVSEWRLGARAVAAVVKRYCEAAGLDPARHAGHSLRSGLVTEAYRQGVPEAAIMGTTRHKSATMLARYRRESDAVKQGAMGTLDMSPSASANSAPNAEEPLSRLGSPPHR